MQNDYYFTDQTSVDLVLCASGLSEGAIPTTSNFVLMDGVSNDKVVGIAITGAAIFQGVSELQYDALFPKAYGNQNSP